MQENATKISAYIIDRMLRLGSLNKTYRKKWPETEQDACQSLVFEHFFGHIPDWKANPS